MDGSLKRAGDWFAALLGRRAEEDAAGSSHREPELPESWPEGLPFRKRPKPYSRAISWSPAPQRPLIPHTSPALIDKRRPYELFVAQSALREVRQHLTTASTPEPFGFLLGQVIFCPWSETPYVVIDAVRRETQSLPGSTEVDRFRHAWIAATRDARHRRAQLIGWYHQHGVLGLRLSEWDLNLQDEFFPEPWQCALIIAFSGGPTGGWIQRSRRARLFRKGLAPFYELIELDAKLVDGLRPSVVDWRNYVPSQQVHVIQADWPDPDAGGRRWRAPSHATEGVVPLEDGGADGLDVLEFPAREDAKEAETPVAEAETPGPARAPQAAEPPGGEELDLGEEPWEILDEPAAAESEAEPDAVEDEPAEAEPATEAEPAAAEVEPEPQPRVLDTPMFPLEESEPLVPLRARVGWGTTHGPEGAEVDRKRSSEWLVELVGEVLAYRREADAARLAKAAESQAEVPTASEEPDLDGGTEAEQVGDDAAEPVVPVEAATPAAEVPAEEPADAEEEEGEPEAVEPPAAAEEPAKERPPAIRPRPTPREGPIPVVLIADEPWRPPKRALRIAAGIAVLLGASFAVRTFAFGGSEPEQPVRPTQPRPAAFQQPAEFTRLASEFRRQLQDYRQNLVDFQPGQSACGVLAEDYLRVRSAHADLAAYVQTTPQTNAAFSSLDADFEAASERFAGTACQLPPPTLEPTAPEGIDGEAEARPDVVLPPTSPPR